jgi:hypothetical protein
MDVRLEGLVSVLLDTDDDVAEADVEVRLVLSSEIDECLLEARFVDDLVSW